VDISEEVQHLTTVHSVLQQGVGGHSHGKHCTETDTTQTGAFGRLDRHSTRVTTRGLGESHDGDADAHSASYRSSDARAMLKRCD